MADSNPIRFVKIEGGRPSFCSVAHHLWGADVDFDSDGNAKSPDSSDWTELTLINRRDPRERIDVDPVQTQPLILQVIGTKEELVVRAAQYLAEATGGALVSAPFGGSVPKDTG